MADQNENEFEEEFDFESDEGLLEEPTPGMEGMAAPSKKPPLPIIIGGAVVGVVILFVGYKLIFGGETKEELAPPPVVQAPPPPAPIAAEKPAPAPAPEPDLWADADQGKDADKPKITPQMVVDKLDAAQKESKQDIQRLESKLNDLVSKLGTVDQSVSSFNKDVTQISIKLEALNQELKVLATPAPTEQPAKIQESEPAYVAPTLSVHAIIPGRAWIKTKDGRTLTVTEGDPVEGYGKVIVIDAPSGIVITSSGVVLRQ